MVMCYTKIFFHTSIYCTLNIPTPISLSFSLLLFFSFLFLVSISNSSGWPQTYKMKLALTSHPLASTSQVLEL